MGCWDPGAGVGCECWLCAAKMLLVRAGSSQAAEPYSRVPVLPGISSALEPCAHRPSLIRGSQSTRQRADKCCCPGFVPGETETRAVKGKITGSQEEVPGVSAGLFPHNAPRLLLPSGQNLLLKGVCAVVRGRAAAPSCCPGGTWSSAPGFGVPAGAGAAVGSVRTHRASVPAGAGPR